MSGAGVFRSAQAAAAVEAEYRRVLDGWPSRLTRTTVPTSQGDTFVISCGAKEAPPVVLLHGAQANSASWLPDVPLWSGRFRLHAVDMIGEAGLSAPVRPSLADDSHARWLDDVFAGLGLTEAALVGTSLGGWLALDYSVRRLAAVKALALICPAGIGRQKNFLLKAAPLLLLGSWGRRRMLEQVFGPRADLPEEVRPLARLAELIGRGIRPRVVSIPRLSDAELQGLRMPLLAILGGRDVLIDTRDARARLERHVPQAEICFLEDGYHFLPGQAPRVLQFLERHLAPG